MHTCLLAFKTPGNNEALDLKSSMAYFLGAPAKLNLEPNFSGYTRDLRVDGYEPITIAWGNFNPDFLQQTRAL